LIIAVYRKSNVLRNIQLSPTNAVAASEFRSKVVFDEIEKRLREVMSAFCVLS